MYLFEHLRKRVKKILEIRVKTIKGLHSRRMHHKRDCIRGVFPCCLYDTSTVPLTACLPPYPKGSLGTGFVSAEMGVQILGTRVG